MAVNERVENSRTSPLAPPSLTGSIQKEIEETRTTTADGMAALEKKSKHENTQCLKITEKVSFNRIASEASFLYNLSKPK